MNPRDVLLAVRHLGARWAVYRLRYGLERRTGVLRRRCPGMCWDATPLERHLAPDTPRDLETYGEYRAHHAPRFFFSPDDRPAYDAVLNRWDKSGTSPVEQGDDVAAGYIRFFSHHRVATGLPPDWTANPFTGEKFGAGRHWTDVDEFSGGDIKLVWEANRFAFSYALVRAYWRTGDERYPRLFWQLVESWRDANPPNMGPNWKCGQEASLRLMAWVFGLYGFLRSRETTPDRIWRMAQMIAVSAERIEGNFRYALSQKNNHAISEAVGLWTTGLLFPEFRKAGQWLRAGEEALAKLSGELFYEDGAFSQHSVNYQRVALHGCLWAVRLGDLNDHPLGDEVKERVAKSAELLFHLQDESTGRLPCQGQNDGALVLPLSNCDYEDYRPVVQAVTYLGTGRRRYETGPWDEDLLWLFGPESLEDAPAHAIPNDLSAEGGGYYTLRTGQGFSFIRCASFKHRPSQADQLHVDIWWKGIDIALDPGTYNYNAAPPWDNPFAHTRYHNTVCVDDRDQMDRVGRFLWLPWAEGRVLLRSRSERGALAYWEGAHHGYRRFSPPVEHHRAVVALGSEHWMVLDHLRSLSPRRYTLHWLLKDLPFQRIGRDTIVLDTPHGAYRVVARSYETTDMEATVVRASGETPRGWRSRYYYQREPAVSFETCARGERCLFASGFGPGEWSFFAKGSEIIVESSEWAAKIALSNHGREGGPIVRRLSLRASWGNDELELS